MPPERSLFKKIIKVLPFNHNKINIQNLKFNCFSQCDIV